MKSRKINNIFFSIIILSLLTSCYPIREDLTKDELDMVITMYDKNYYSSERNDFQNFRTFVIPDTIVHITESGVTDTISRAYDSYIMAQVRSNMLNAGYIEETKPATNEPDIAVTISISTGKIINTDWYQYWGWYWPDYMKGAEASANSNGHYYPFYPPYYGLGSTYTYPAGSILLEMVDVSRFDPSVQEIPVIWAGIINGATGGSTEAIQSRISTGIDQCFSQSAYLIKTLH
jgi:hypothetical protein